MPHKPLFILSNSHVMMGRRKNLAHKSVKKSVKINKTIIIGDNTITITKDYIDLATLSEDPSLREGRLWYNTTDRMLKFSDGEKAIPVAGIGKSIIGFGEAGFIVAAGEELQHQPFSNKTGASVGMPVPYSGVASRLKVYVWSNSLDGSCFVRCRRNEGEEQISVEVPAGETGLFENNTDTLSFLENDRIDFVIDTREATSGDIDIAAVSVAYTG